MDRTDQSKPPGMRDRIDFLYRMLPKIKHVDGCFVELGVSFGHHLQAMVGAMKYEGKGRDIYGFDIWGGMVPWAPEDESTLHPRVKESTFTKKRTWTARIEDVHITLGKFLDDVTLVQGDIEETFIGFNKPIALANLDVDYYRGYQVALPVLWRNLSSRGIIMLDEYHQPQSWPGARQATDEFLETIPGEYELRDSTRFYLRKK